MNLLPLMLLRSSRRLRAPGTHRRFGASSGAVYGIENRIHSIPIYNSQPAPTRRPTRGLWPKKLFLQLPNARKHSGSFWHVTLIITMLCSYSNLRILFAASVKRSLARVEAVSDLVVSNRTRLSGIHSLPSFTWLLWQWFYLPA